MKNVTLQEQDNGLKMWKKNVFGKKIGQIKKVDKFKRNEITF